MLKKNWPSPVQCKYLDFSHKQRNSSKKLYCIILSYEWSNCGICGRLLRAMISAYSKHSFQTCTSFGVCFNMLPIICVASFKALSFTSTMHAISVAKSMTICSNFIWSKLGQAVKRKRWFLILFYNEHLSKCGLSMCNYTNWSEK